MPVRFEQGRVVLDGVVGVEDAELLLEGLQGCPTCPIDLSACVHLHTADLQVLMVAQSTVERWPEDPALRIWIEAALLSSRGNLASAGA